MRFAVALTAVVGVTLVSVPVAAQGEFTWRLGGLDSLLPPGDWSRDLPPDIADRLAESSVAQLAAALDFTCTETAQNSRGHKRPDRLTAAKEASYLLRYVGRPSPFLLEEYRAGRGIPGPTVPLPLVWSFLFDDSYRPFFAVRDLGEVIEDGRLVRRLGFTGSLPFRDGADPREWGGVLDVDARTLLPVSVTAEPRNQHEYLLCRLDRERRSLRIAFFEIFRIRTVKPALGQRARVTFTEVRPGLVLPDRAELYVFRAMSENDVRPWSRYIREYRDCRFFESSAEETSGTGTPRPRKR